MNRRANRQSGFTLIELVVSLFVAVEILVAAAVAFDVHSRVAQIQMQVTDLQQSLRVAQYDLTRVVRSAGRGGLPVELAPNAIFNPSDTIPALKGLAIEIRNNVTGDDRYIARETTKSSPQAIDGSDILAVRGCIGGNSWQIDPSTFDWDSNNDLVADSDAVLTIPRTSVAGLLQPLGSLVEDVQAYDSADTDKVTWKGKFILVSPTSLQSYAVTDIVSMDFDGPATDPTEVRLTLNLNNNSTLDPYNNDLVTPVRQYPPNMAVSLGCFLEEYRYYVREVAGDAVTPIRPRLTRARFEPGTELAYLGLDSNFTLDLADGVFDLQVALGLDTDLKQTAYSETEPGGSYNDDTNWVGDDDTIYEADPFDPAQDRTADDWLYNDPGDDVTNAIYTTHAIGGNAGNPVEVYFVRINTAARTTRPDRIYQAGEIDTRTDGEWIEDHDYDTDPPNAYITGDNLKYRRRILQTIVDMRNL